MYRFSSSGSNGEDGDTTTTMTGEDVVVEITEPIVPCGNLCRLPYVVGDPRSDPKQRMARCQYFLEMLGRREGLRGWYAKVVRGGIVRVGDSLSAATLAPS